MTPPGTRISSSLLPVRTIYVICLQSGLALGIKVCNSGVVWYSEKLWTSLCLRRGRISSEWAKAVLVWTVFGERGLRWVGLRSKIQKRNNKTEQQQKPRPQPRNRQGTPNFKWCPEEAKRRQWFHWTQRAIIILSALIVDCFTILVMSWCRGKSKPRLNWCQKSRTKAVYGKLILKKKQINLVPEGNQYKNKVGIPA